MASLIIQDTFEPYYVGRDGSSDTTAKSSSKKSSDVSGADKSRSSQRSRASASIVLPVEAPVPAVPVRRERRAIAHH